MTGPLYFQWQNEILLKTIYPMREAKLRDFLVYFAEIDLWAQYKDKDIASLPDEVKAYTEAQTVMLASAYETYCELRAYFLTPDVRPVYAAKFAKLDESELAKINQLHVTFISNLPKLTDVRREMFFVTQQEPVWASHRTQIWQMVSSKQRRIDNLAFDYPKRDEELSQLDQLEDVLLPMVDEELLRLRAFIKSFDKISGRKLELYMTKEKARLRKDEITRKLADLQTSIQPFAAKQKTLNDELARLKSPPDFSSLQQYFLLPDVSGQIRQQYAQAADALIAQVNGFHKSLMDEFNYVKEAGSKLSTVRNHLYNWQQQLNSLGKQAAQIETNLRNMPANWAKRAENEALLRQLREVNLKVLGDDVAKLSDFYAAFQASATPQAELAKTIQSKEQELAQAGQNLSVFTKQADVLQMELSSIEATLNIEEKTYLTQYSPAHPVTVKDLVRGKTEELKAGLARKNHQELLEDVFKRFLETPERFPLWLQYMIIHFSGMRYRTAHGTWASAKDLLIRLNKAKVEKDFQKIDDTATQQLGREKADAYTAAGPHLPRLAQAAEKDWQARLTGYLRDIVSNGPKTRRAALMSLTADEYRYDVEKMSEEEALSALSAMKDTFPAWAWKEIIKLTPLRVNLVNDPGWEKLTPQEEAQKNAMPFGDGLGALISKWKEDNTTLWRDEHGRTHRLIVGSAVCNETAEHCQHMRGHLPPGGLTAKAPWYMKNEKENTLPGAPRPYFTKPKSIEDFNVGASILWLRFVNEEPNPWRVAAPLVTKDGDGLIPKEFKQRKAGANTFGVWTYTEGDVVMRTRTTLDANKQKVNQQQWLRWIHEATVAAVADTADGRVVLTFETALPDDDPGLSSIGLFKHSESNALFTGSEDNYNGAFIGFVPEGQLPVDDLEVMLDWNKILQRDALLAGEMEAYRRKYIRRE
jgi:hypothetical protein